MHFFSAYPQDTFREFRSQMVYLPFLPGQTFTYLYIHLHIIIVLSL